MLREYLLKVWLPHRLPCILTVGSLFGIVEYVESIVVFRIGLLSITNLQLLLFIPPICLLCYSALLKHFFPRIYYSEDEISGNLK